MKGRAKIEWEEKAGRDTSSNMSIGVQEVCIAIFNRVEISPVEDGDLKVASIHKILRLNKFASIL